MGADKDPHRGARIRARAVRTPPLRPEAPANAEATAAAGVLSALVDFGPTEDGGWWKRPWARQV